ncbi:PDZ domain-containing protein [Streptomyces sp. Amel2xC10]|uniref:PDZ domain-containing protein n=1 Tax=Streptomyces sp. Amel2xC10 TaxID=1305826 RepID=UPI000A087BAD|nr:PDZ domain-containing protein [Streptomyces sp. Amel2xC10]SMF38177.1 Trypsin-like serine proteases, typically periplasmic, contain C-terminal PDZ domain [Streptomyces sp. Amel2xC10]
MEQTALRPKPLPGQEPGDGPDPGGRTPRPHAARRGHRRLATLLTGLLVGTVLVLTGVGLGTVGATVIGMSRLAELQRASAPPRPAAPSVSPAPAEAPAARAALGVEVMDADRAGARIVAVDVPGPGYRAGLVRGDVLLNFGETRIDSAADLLRAVRAAGPGEEVRLTVRHENGAYQQLNVVPGVVT